MFIALFAHGDVIITNLTEEEACSNVDVPSGFYNYNYFFLDVTTDVDVNESSERHIIDYYGDSDVMRLSSHTEQ